MPAAGLPLLLLNRWRHQTTDKEHLSALVMGLAAKENSQVRSSGWIAHAAGYAEELPSLSTSLPQL